MDAAAEQQMSTKRRQQERINNRRQIPPEIVETILMRLPLKYVFRFSRVSKSWRSLIFEPSFMKKRAAVCDVRRLLMSPHRGSTRYDPKFKLADASSCPLSSVSSDNAVEDATPIIFPIEGKPILRASFGELCCVEVNNSLYLWNPSIDIYKKLPNPSLRSDNCFYGEYVYGLGYDSNSDDYKIFRLALRAQNDHRSELYSLRSDSWRMIDHQPFPKSSFAPKKCVFVGGAFHWSTWRTLICFDLATEKYGNVARPPAGELPGSTELDVSALREKLCVHCCQSDGLEFHFVMWVMEEYGIEKSWTKIFEIRNADGIPFGPNDESMFQDLSPIVVTPLHLFDNGELLFRVYTYELDPALFMYKDEEPRPWKMICSGISHGFVYDESLFSPLKFVKLN